MNVRQIDLAREKLDNATFITVLTGAGISAESGIPTFRGKGGLWKQFKPEELATPEAFRNRPGIVWEWYHWRRELISKKSPNEGHLSLVKLEEKTRGFTLITQNVDGLHALAGNRNIIELHGTLWKTRCTGCHRVLLDRSLKKPRIPNCKVCHRELRPHVVWFGEGIDSFDLEGSLKACRECEVFLVIGTSSVVQPAASFASLARSEEAFIIEVNIVPSLQIKPDISLTGKASDILPAIIPS
ncbi:MAG: NAD-dependent deacetylase [Nitrospiria bacterium]